MEWKAWQEYAVARLSSTMDQKTANQTIRFLLNDLGISIHALNSHLERLDAAIERLSKGEPLAYVSGKAYFMDLILNIKPGVLIPRPETEELVHLIVQDAKYLNQTSLKILDIGTGSGCIALALKHNLPQSNVTAWDISPTALEIAQDNASLLQLDITLEQVDILDPADHVGLDKWDIIVSNPPYIPRNEIHHMGEDVVQYEPEIALFTKDENGLEFYQAIQSFAVEHLLPNGRIYLEINEFRSKDMSYIFTPPAWNAQIHQDLQGKDRMMVVRR